MAGRGYLRIYSKALSTTYQQRKMLLGDLSAMHYSVNRKLVSGGNQGHELLSLQNTTFSSRENSQSYPLAFSHGEGIFINFIALQNLFVLSEKKRSCKAMIRIFEWPQEIRWDPGLGPTRCMTFHLSRRSQERELRGDSLGMLQLEPAGSQG